MRAIFLFLFLVSQAFAFDGQQIQNASSFTQESHPGTTWDDLNNIRIDGDKVVSIKNGNWMRFQDFDFGSSPSATDFWINAAKGNSGTSTLRLRLGHPTTGEMVGSVQINSTGNWDAYQRFGLTLTRPLTGNSDLYLVCEGSSDLFNLRQFQFRSYRYDRDRDVASSDYTVESHPNDLNFIQRVGGQVQKIQNGTWVEYDRYNFENGAGYLWIEAAAAANSGGTITIRAGSHTATPLGTINIPSTGTGGLDKFKPFGCKLSSPLVGIQDLYLTFSGGTGDLFNLGKLRFQRLAPDYKAPGTITGWVKRDPDSQTFKAGTFTTESNTGDDNNIRSENGAISYINTNQWVGYQGFDFGAGANTLTIHGASQNAGGTVEVRVGHPTNGQPIGSISITNTGSWGTYVPRTVTLGQTLTGVQDLYLRFVGGSGYLFNVRDLRFQLLDPNPLSTGRLIAAHTFTQQSSPGVSQIPGGVGITSVTNGSWISFGNFNFGAGADLITLMAATPERGGAVEIRVDSVNGPRVATLDVTFTGSWTFFREYTAALSQTITGSRNVFMRFVDTNGQSGNLLNLKEFIFEKKLVATPPPSNEGTLEVYPPVPNPAPTNFGSSPYYTYQVRKVGDTEWMNPFAWFTECKIGGEPYANGYYSQDIGGWSHTYCNFAMGKNTPIEIKITRNPTNPHGAPAGPIFMANAYPAQKIESCEIVDGEVMIRMNNPAFITVDIDGQMDARDAPRIAPVEASSSKPYASRQLGSHAVSIFANPVINDKPQIGGSGVRVINPGDPLPAANDDSWTTLFFAPGVHSFTGKTNGIPNDWVQGNQHTLRSNKNYYIPGDAIVYGNFDSSGVNLRNIRFYGHGTLSGRYIPHFSNFTPPAYHHLDYMFRMNQMDNCVFEDITIADPANHAFLSDFGGGSLRRWVKQIGWRANSDMGGMPNGVTEDCFFRVQDDGPYTGFQTVRRCTFWFDCNGAPMRSDLITNRTAAPDYHAVIEDCDYIYVRSNFWWTYCVNFLDHTLGGSLTYPDGTRHSGQQAVYRNLRFTDPRATRGHIAIKGSPQSLAGLRFENIEFRYLPSWSGKNFLDGRDNREIKYCYFTGVSINGKSMNQAMVDDPAQFDKYGAVSNLVFRDLPAPTPLSMTTVNTTGLASVLNLDDPQSTYTGNGALVIPNNVSLGSSDSVAPTVFEMSGGLITINSGATLVNGGWSKGIWTNNKSSMQINGTLDVSDGNPVIVDALNGAGAITLGSVSSFVPTELHVGVLGGSGTFSGTIQEPNLLGAFFRIVKQGDGTQTFDNLANQKPGELVINAGVVNLSTATHVTVGYPISGAGNLTKSGTGVLTLTGGLTLTGSISVNEGTLSVGTNLAPTANLSIAPGAVLNLNFAGQRTVTRLAVGGSGPLPPGIYSSSHATYGAFFTGTGSLLILGLDYDGWAAANNGGQLPHLDHDMDGMPNGVEYFMGQTGSSFTAIPAIINTNGILSWTWPFDPSARVTYKFQLSEDLVDWTTEVTLPDPSLQVTAPVSPATLGSVKLTLPTVTPMRYARLVVTPNSAQ